MRAELNATGLGYQFFPAVDAGLGQHLSFSNYAAEFCLRAWRRPLAPGEIGCFASHYRLWQRCVESNEPMIVMEDDVEISPRLREVVDLLPGLARFGYIRLSGISPRAAFQPLSWELPSDWRLVRFLEGPMGTQGYALFPEGAKRLLAGAGKWIMPVDNYMDRFWQHHVSCTGLLPFVVKQKQTSSVIRDMGGFRDPVWKPMRVAVRLTDSARRAVWNFRFTDARQTGTDLEGARRTGEES